MTDEPVDNAPQPEPKPPPPDLPTPGDPDPWHHPRRVLSWPHLRVRIQTWKKVKPTPEGGDPDPW